MNIYESEERALQVLRDHPEGLNITSTARVLKTDVSTAGYLLWSLAAAGRATMTRRGASKWFRVAASRTHEEGTP